MGTAAWLLTCLAWLIGIAWQLQEAALWPWPVYVAGLMLSLGLGLTWRRYQSGRWLRLGLRSALGLMAVALLAWGSTGWRASSQMAQQLPSDWLGRDVPVVVQIEGLPKAVSGGAYFDARVVSWPQASGADSLPQHISLRMNTPAGVLPMAGQQWRLFVRLHPPDGHANPAGFDVTLPMFERGIRAIGQVRDRGTPPEKLSDQPAYPWQGAIDRLRGRIRSAILARVTDKQAAGVLAGLSVGDQSAIDQADWDVFRRTGVAHLVSISGSHIAMVGWLFAVLIRAVWARFPVLTHRFTAADAARWASVVLSGLYAMLAGWGVPAQRTVLMMLVMTLLTTGGRRWPQPLVWLISAVVVTAWDPWALRQAGFWLSYVAVAVLMSSGQTVRAQARRPPTGDTIDTPWWGAVRDMGVRVVASTRHVVWDVVRTQGLVTIALTPLAAVCFQQMSVVSFLANMVAIPLFTIGITPLSLLGIVWSPGWDAGAWLIQQAMQVLSDMSAWSWAVVTSPALPGWAAVAVVVAGFSMTIPAHWTWRMAVLPLFMPLIYQPQSLRLIPAPHPGEFAVVAVDIGQGTGVLVRTAHHQLLFDSGPRIGTQSDAGQRILLPLLQAMGVPRLDTLMISHQDTDHVGGAAAIVRALPIGQLLTSLDEAHPLRHQPGVSGRPSKHEACVAGQHWVWDGVDFVVLHPTAEDYARRSTLPPNALSCVLRVSRPGAVVASVLLTGDIESAQEAAILSRQSEAEPAEAHLRSTVLMVPHHGSKTSSTAAFLQAVAPTQSVIQVGVRNPYRHPSPTVLARYDAMGLNTVATPLCGAYLWRSSDMVGSCWRGTHKHYWDEASASVAVSD
ncbi:MAG: DNA internalization-related competence protein ComEC/Rec2 [Aquabacterium sp.]|nr:DNA internalization-related competence protein ComEC/Rec2 [Aquabacterium sp.]